MFAYKFRRFEKGKGGRRIRERASWKCNGGEIVPFIIVNTAKEIDDETGKPLYWNNDLGWVDKQSATRFKFSENLNLPIDGKWVAVMK